MNIVLSIIYPAGLKILTDIHQNLRLPFTMVLHGRGTATDRMLDLLGIESRENRIVLTVADPQKTRELIEEQRRVLYLGMPGNGLVIALPIKSIGGGKTLAYLSGDASPKYTPEATYDHELILAIANEGCTDMVMDAARAAGATGGTVIHGKGVGQENAKKFFNVSIAQEKEVVMIVAYRPQKAAIMQSILKLAGPDSKAGAIVLSLPVSEIAGLRKQEN
ncbi:MAG: P-II family nitrogen regulator [Eubacteriales bacterium]|nr:P-II family nitrogen regulator [Clostridiales bacterium]MDY2600463.1 P-II family nitrogen regulator [Eubacteriales bacterium]